MVFYEKPIQVYIWIRPKYKMNTRLSPLPVHNISIQSLIILAAQLFSC